MGVKVTDTDHGYARLLQTLYGVAASRPSVFVGIQEKDADTAYDESREENKRHASAIRRGVAYVRKSDRAANDTSDTEPATIIQVATFNEFGTDRIHERSFLRSFFDEHRDEIREKFTSLMKSVVRGKRTKEQILDLIGLWAVGQIQLRMAEGIAPDNAESTVARKGSSTPLIDSGLLRASISFVVEGL
jgi:hypothetical protein